MSKIKSEKAKKILQAYYVDGNNNRHLFFLKGIEALEIAETEAEERHAKELQELKDNAVEWFRDFVTNYAFEAGHTEIEKGAEHYIEVFTQKLNERCHQQKNYNS